MEPGPIDLARRVTAPLLGIVIALLFFRGARDLDEIAREGQLGPGFWPRLVLIGLALACVAKLIEEWQRSHGPAESADAGTAPPVARGKLLSGIGLIVAYAALAPLIGFPLMTAVFIVASMWLSGSRSIPAMGTAVVLGTTGLLYVFVKLVYLPLPKGDGPFEAFTLALYRALRIF